jgi:hypothetical protein
MRLAGLGAGCTARGSRTSGDGLELELEVTLIDGLASDAACRDGIGTADPKPLMAFGDDSPDGHDASPTNIKAKTSMMIEANLRQE